jgi:hypothetical protein
MQSTIDHNPTFCDCLIHPFQHDPGISQSGRVMEELLSGNAKIDARKTADLLSYFYQLSAHINYYDNNLNISDWRPFFEKSIPFVLAALIRYNTESIKENQAMYSLLFSKRPSAPGLQLSQLYIYYNTVKRIFDWHRKLKGSDLPVERVLESIIRDKIRQPLKRFININRIAVNEFGVKAIDFSSFLDNETWLKDDDKLYEESNQLSQILRQQRACNRLNFLHDETVKLFSGLFDPIGILSKAAELSIEQSFNPLKDELQKKHTPHLALLFTFLKLFQKLQGDLNGYTKKHLDFFYKEILKLKPKEAVPDKANLVFAIQKELDHYLLKKGLLTKDGKDINKEEILFALDDEIVVNQAQVKDVRTLFVNNLLVPASNPTPEERHEALIEGVYMASDATKADGIDKDFQTEVKNYYTVGNKDSKYIQPGTNLFKPYPSARLGFILASPVLLLQEGKRTVTISIDCKLDETLCENLRKADFPASKKCCEEIQPAGTPVAAVKSTTHFLKPLSSIKLLKAVGPGLVLRMPELTTIVPLRARSVDEMIMEHPQIIDTAVQELQLGTQKLQQQQQALQSQSTDPIEILRTGLIQEFYYVSEELISEAVKKGLSAGIAERIRKHLKSSNSVSDPEPKPYCYCPIEEKRFDAVVEPAKFETGADAVDITNELIKEFFPKRRPLRIEFSGEKEWVTPSEEKQGETNISIVKLSSSTFTLKINVTLNAEKPAVTFYNKENLGEDFETDLPLVKVQLDDHYKMLFPLVAVNSSCCLEHGIKETSLQASLYHILKNIKVEKNTKIDVQVCGVKNIVVQNDESLLDVNSPVFLFGPRPKINANFYIGAKEIFCKNWKQVIVNFNWKDKPARLKDYYHGYGDIFFGIEDRHFEESNFKFLAATREDGGWHNYKEVRQLFKRDRNLLCNYYPFLLPGCGNSFGLPNSLKRKTVRAELINTDFILPESLNADGTIKNIPSIINPADGSVMAASFKPGVVTGPNASQVIPKEAIKGYEDYIRRSCVDAKFIKTDYVKNTAFSGGQLLPAAILADNSLDPLQFSVVLVQDPAGIEYLPSEYIKGYPRSYSYIFESGDFDSHVEKNRGNACFVKEPYTVNTRNGFLRFSLLGQDFQHTRYSFVLARQMMALGKLPSIYLGPVYDGVDPTTGVVLVADIGLGDLFDTIKRFATVSTDLKTRLADIPGILEKIRDEYVNGNHISLTQTDYENALGNPLPGIDTFDPAVTAPFLKNADFQTLPAELKKYRLNIILNELAGKFSADELKKINDFLKIRAVIPNEPYTPQITEIELDYKATAEIADINLIHLYPYKQTFKVEEIEQEPTLFPTYCDEGTLFIGFEKLVPGNNLNVLFQLAEATADSESNKQDVYWYYLHNNKWKRLRTGFEVLEDGTRNLTTSGIIKFAMPESMTKNNTVMPKDLHWIKAAIPRNSKSVSETTGIHTQAVQVSFTNTAANDKSRLIKPVEPGQISKLETADASVKQVLQPYESFGGQVPEEQGMFYVRVSELLRHKGRAIQKFDYERIVLDGFPEIFKTKCINHSFGLNAHFYKNDFPYAPGYIITAVIPDLNKLKAGNAFEPKAPVSLLERIDAYVRRRTSPFVRFRSMNPRYEKIHLCVKVKLLKGKDENYYQEKLKEDIRLFLAPWAIGEYDKLKFGQCVNRSDVIGFMESLDYIDFILELHMRHESEKVYKKNPDGTRVVRSEVCPKTPRSILIGGDIEVCIDPQACEDWGPGNCNNRIKLIECSKEK